jgi:hypothetical protein
MLLLLLGALCFLSCCWPVLLLFESVLLLEQRDRALHYDALRPLMLLLLLLVQQVLCLLLKVCQQHVKLLQGVTTGWLLPGLLQQLLLLVQGWWQLSRQAVLLLVMAWCHSRCTAALPFAGV